MSSSRRQYPFHLIEPKWQKAWGEQQAFRAFNPGDDIPASHPFAIRHGVSGKVAVTQLPAKFYILDMFPYPSGAGLHVGHPEGYTATDILSRYRRACGFNVLHPMGWDAFGLPAEQYAVKTGQHPRQTTEQNIATFKRQIQSLGFSYDWSRELATTDPDYFKWTQWIFLKLYNSWFNPETNKAEPIETLEYPAACNTEEKKRAFRDSRRLAYKGFAPVNWSPDLGTVLSNEEVEEWREKGFTIERRPMQQWMLRITAYAERLLADLDTIDWSASLKKMQQDWIGRSEGADVTFAVEESDITIKVFTTRPDTLFGATYMVIAPEHEFLNGLMKEGRWPETTRPLWKGSGETWATTQTRHEFKPEEILDLPPLAAVETYRAWVAKRSDRERTEPTKDKTGVFTGLFAINPVNRQRIPIFMADYVLATYGTGAIMAVPAHDERDFEFAEKFGLKITNVLVPPEDWLRKYALPSLKQESLSELQRMWSEGAIDANNNVLSEAFEKYPAYCDDGIATNSNAEISLNGLPTAEAKEKITDWLEAKGLGKRTINYKLRDWLFSRQRYWGEPFPIVWKRDASGNLYHEALPESSLPVLPPALTDYKPTATGEPPLARAKDWVNLPDGSTRETNTMPQWAGSCWYYLRYLDAKNAAAFVGHEAESYWMGGVAVEALKRENVEAATSGHVSTLQHFNALTTTGVDLYVGGTEHAVLHLLYARFWHKVLYDLGYVSTPEPFFKLVNQGLILGEDGQKMSKSRGNVVNPDDILKEFGADAFRLYEMFMGPLQDAKPWNTRGVEGVYRFLGRVWRLFVDEQSETEFEQAETTAETQRRGELLSLIMLHIAIKDVEPTSAQLKTLHACIKKVTEDLDGMRFNTAISAMMVFVNDAMTWETKPSSVLKTFLQMLQPFAPHITEELWEKLHSALRTPHSALAYAPWPKFDPSLLVESEIEIPVSVNGKMRDVIKVAADADNAALEAAAKSSEKVKAFMDGKAIKKVIVVPRKMVNIVVG